MYICIQSQHNTIEYSSLKGIYIYLDHKEFRPSLYRRYISKGHQCSSHVCSLGMVRTGHRDRPSNQDGNWKNCKSVSNWKMWITVKHFKDNTNNLNWNKRRNNVTIFYISFKYLTISSYQDQSYNIILFLTSLVYIMSGKSVTFTIIKLERNYKMMRRSIKLSSFKLMTIIS